MFDDTANDVFFAFSHFDDRNANKKAAGEQMIADKHEQGRTNQCKGAEECQECHGLQDCWR
jgi:hypothetical protein